LRSVGERPTRKQLAALYGHLCECLEHGVLYDGMNY